MVGRRAAVLVGCLYRNTSHELRGCTNDVEHWRRLLIDRFNFGKDDIVVLTDDTRNKPTKSNILKALGNMIQGAEPRAVLFFFFSGHGTWIQKSSPGNVQAIVPLDAINTEEGNDLITSNDIQMLVNKLPLEVTLTILSDSGHSVRPIIGEPPQNQTLSLESGPQNVVGTKLALKSIPPRWFRSPSINPSPSVAQSDVGILLGACQPDETAFEVVVDNGDQACGAFTKAIQEVLEQHARPISNNNLKESAKEKLNKWRVYQRPRLYCSNGNGEAIFLSQS